MELNLKNYICDFILSASLLVAVLTLNSCKRITMIVCACVRESKAPL